MNRLWLTAGLVLATFSTLLLETLDARFLSVLTWYHLSFFAVSIAMLGMAAGAVFVFLHPEWFSPDRAPKALARATWGFALSIPASHLVTLVLPFRPLTNGTAMEVLSIAVSTAVLTVPFMVSGIVVTVALTRCGGAIGRLYAADLAGAAAGCLLVVPVLEWSNASSAIFLSGAAAAAAAVCFHRGAAMRGATKGALLAVGLIALAVYNTGSHEIFQVIYPKNHHLWLTNALNSITRWNSHSYVLVQQPSESPAFMWGPGRGADRFKVRIAWLAIDGEAGSPITEWNGDPNALEWVSYDVTTAPYSIRNGSVAVVGVGGGRDILAALWAKNRSIVGVDVNQIMLDLLQESHRDYANIANQPNVRLVHDDGRAYLTRTDDRFDVIQMSLVDTWAATGAGAFTLSENGLYTLEAWRIFLDRLTPGGVYSVSRWFDPSNVSETSRLVGLGMAALLDRGVEDPLRQLCLIVRDRVATLMVSNQPFTAFDRLRLQNLADSRDFRIAVSPWTGAADPGLLDRIVHARTKDELQAAAGADPHFDYTAPTDGRPYYFNMLKPAAIFDYRDLPRGGALGGNLRATLMLFVLLGVAAVMVASIIVWPLVRAGRPPMPGRRFATTMAYFATIGFAFMLIQIGLVQRFSVYLGHPTYTLAIVLFSMLLFTGAGSFVSERLRLDRPSTALVPLAIALALVSVALLLPAAIASTATAGLVARSTTVLLFTAPLSVLLGMCFPLGVRTMDEAPGVVAWAWGVNGAFGVLASILAVAISIWIGIDANFWLAAVLYASLAKLLAIMLRVGRG